MAFYAVFDIEVTDPVAYQEYAKLAAPSIAKYGGKYLVRGGQTEILEGDWLPKRLVILQFENEKQARDWYESPEYKAAKEIRRKAARSKAIFSSGYEPT